MKAKIAVATVSGRAYYWLVNELKAKKIPFISVVPGESIPPHIQVVITTQEEEKLITHPNVVVFDERAGPAIAVSEALRVIQGKQSYEKVVVGVDPGKTTGIAVLADGNVLETAACSSLRKATETIAQMLSRVPALSKTVRVGDGAPSYARELLRLLDRTLPREVLIEVVSEVGTSRGHRRGASDITAAIKIGSRKGSILPRGEVG